eukprot:CAMPEP_0113671676 /NCGR_PEP_ID=MMETSP0038_2-20120614/5833_1 /TAXON_ID=2898 /ORGANISM="Cryptomonas paramecium" /LENGTH=187 /DNA_ID=CAMNT_0000587847 /DNA_START=209 /DNA_END=769 /DNA_ORIENTATION=+ /assembly_acc=CAM_ASM_000170
MCHGGKQGFDTGKIFPKKKQYESSMLTYDPSLDRKNSTDRRSLVAEAFNDLDSCDFERPRSRQERGPSLLFPEPSTYVGGTTDEELAFFETAFHSTGGSASRALTPGRATSGLSDAGSVGSPARSVASFGTGKKTPHRQLSADRNRSGSSLPLVPGRDLVRRSSKDEGARYAGEEAGRGRFVPGGWG